MAIENIGEATHAAALIDTLLEWQSLISIQDGEEWTVRQSRDRAEILNALGTTDMDRVKACSADGSTTQGMFLLVYGNCPDELIADHTDNPFCNRVWEALEPIRTKLEQA